MIVLQQINAQLHDKIPVLILINFILLIVLIYQNWNYIKKALRKIDKSTWFLLGLILMQALLVRWYLPVHQHLMYIDEHWYMEAGKNMLQTGLQGEYLKAIGWPFILSIAFGIFEVSNWVAINTSLLFGTLTVIGVFLLTFIITQSKRVSLLSALIFSLFPLHIKWSATAESNVTSLFFVILTIFFCFVYYKYKKNSLLWLSIISIAFTSQFRPENYFLLVLFLVGCLFYNKELFSEKRQKLMLPLLLFFILTIANLIQVVHFYNSYNWSTVHNANLESNWGISNLINNSLNIGPELFNVEYIPIIITCLVLIGLFYMLRKQKRGFLFLLIWFFTFWIVYFTSWMQVIGARERFFLSFYPIISIFASYGIIFIQEFFSIKLSKWPIRKYFQLVLIAIIIFSFVPLLVDVQQDYLGAEGILETKIIELSEKDIPNNCVIIAHYALVLRSTTDLDVIDTEDFLSTPENQAEIFSKTDCVLFFEDFFCTFNNKFSNSTCNRMKNLYNMNPFKTYAYKHVNFTFYKIW